MNKKIIWLVISLVIIGGLAVGIFYVYLKTGTQNLSASLISIQENIAEVAATKEIGDLLAAKKTPPKKYTWQEVENLATTMASQIASLKTNYRLAEYKKAGTIWAVKIREAAKNTKTWKDIPTDPGDFTVALRDKEAEELFNGSLTNIFELIQFGNSAIERKDKETMRYVAAKLFVQNHWLNGLADHQRAGIFAKLITPAYAAEKNSANQLGLEVDRVQGAIISLMNVAARYYVAENIDKDKAAAADWKKAAEEIVKIIAENDLGPQTLAVLIAGVDAPTQLPPKVQAFNDDCLARGGTLGGVSRTNNYLMTVEDGYYCKYEEDGEKCWKFLSYSGSFANGGEADCEQKNVLPADTGPNAALAKTRPLGQQPTPTTPKPTAPKTPLPDLGQPTGTAAPRIEFVVTQTPFIAQVGERFSYSFCQPAVTRTSDLCTAASTNPRYGLPPYSFSLESGVGFLPYGLTLNLNGLLEGTPTAEGSRTVGICAKDTGGFSVCRKITINVKAAVKPLTISIDSVKCEFISHTTPWDPNPYWAIYKITASGSISSANQQVVVINTGGEAYEQPTVSCGSWSTNIEYRATGSSGPGSAKATCTGTGSTNWQYSIKINHHGPIDLGYSVWARTEDWSSTKSADVQCSDR